ncbi:MAG: TolC family protein, partial [Acidobacteriota bacterium]
MKQVKHYIALLSALLMLAPAGYGQGRSDRTPRLNTDTGFVNNMTRNYKPQYVPPIDVSNSSRLDQLIRAGNLYLSLNDAIALALENNIGLEINRYQFELTDVAYRSSLAGANGAWDPTFAVNQFNYSRSAQIQTNAVTAGGQSVNVGNSQARSFQLSQGFKTGGTATLGFTSNKSTTNNVNSLFVPNLSGGISLQASQPLLRGFGLALNTQGITIAKNNQRAADFGFRTQINTLVNQVVGAYWNLVSASQNVNVARQSLDLSQTQLDQNRKQVDIGTMAPIDILQTEVNVANGEQTLITAQATVLTQEVTLKNLISRNGIASASLAAVHLIPTNRVEVPAVEPVQPIQDLMEAALQSRPELAQTRINLENTQINMRTTKNALLPQLNLTGNISNPASGGVINPVQQTDPLTGAVVPRKVNAELVGGFSNILRQLWAVPTVNYSIGFTLNINLRNRSAQASYATAQLNQRTQELQLQQQINTVRADVNTAQININTARARYASALKAATVQEQVLDAEQKKFALGASTLFVVIQQQNTLTSNRQNLVSAQVAYATAK